MKRFILLCIIVALIVAGCGKKDLPDTQIPQDLTDLTNTPLELPPDATIVDSAAFTISDYFPFEADVYKKFRGTGNEYASFDSHVDYVRDGRMQLRRDNGGTVTVNVYVEREGVLLNVFNQGETYYRYDYTPKSETAEAILTEPLSVGTSWPLQDGSTRTITAVNKQVDTPAGRYKALEVTTENEGSVIRDYFAKGIGLVKTEFRSKETDMTVVSELEKVERKVPLKQLVRFYFPQFDKDRIVYIEREISLNTNEDIIPVLEKEWKTVPEKSGLTKTLTENTRIRGINLDEEKDTVIVDLSGDFIREMNAGTSLESMLLNSIANTVGEYFMKSRVILLIDGKQYESGHVIIDEENPLQVNTEGIQPYKK